MSNWKHAEDDAAGKPENEPKRTAAEDDEHRPPPRSVEITSLELDADDDAGSDPYNCTGQFCVPAFSKYDKD